MRRSFCLEPRYLWTALFMGFLSVSFAPEMHAEQEQITLEACRLRAEQGDLDAQITLARTYTLYGPCSEALKWNKMAGEQGDVESQYEVGVIYTKGGQGCPKDYTLAAKWFGKAAEQGDAAAQEKLGNFFLTGQGVLKNYNKAAEWYTKAAKKGKPGAQYNLANCYLHGRGVSKDFVKSYAWFSLAANRRYRDAMAYRDELKKYMTPQQIAQGRELSARILKESLTSSK